MPSYGKNLGYGWLINKKYSLYDMDESYDSVLHGGINDLHVHIFLLLQSSVNRPVIMISPVFMYMYVNPPSMYSHMTLVLFSEPGLFCLCKPP